MPVIISTDTTWESGTTHRLTDDIQIAPGVTLTIEEDVRVIGDGYEIQVFGTLAGNGLEEDKILFQDVRFESPPNAEEPGEIRISRAIFDQGGFETGTLGFWSYAVSDSIFYNVEGFSLTGGNYLGTSGDHSFLRNAFIESDTIVLDGVVDPVQITNNLFFEARVTDGYWKHAVIVVGTPSDDGEVIVSKNSFISIPSELYALGLANSTGAEMTASQNYFGTTVESEIQDKIYDRADTLALSSFISNDFLEAPHEDTPTLATVINELRGLGIYEEAETEADAGSVEVEVEPEAEHSPEFITGSDVPLGTHSLTLVADVFGTVVFLKNLTEVVTEDSHIIYHAGTAFEYSEVDPIIQTVSRNDEFTSEFVSEIAESFPNSAGISYSTAVALIGQANMESTLMIVAGADGNYVG